MNQKTAKKIRALAKLLVNNAIKNGQDVTFETRYMENTGRRKKQSVYATDDQGNTIIGPDGHPIVKNTFDISTGTISVAKECYRGIYRTLKKRELASI